MKGIWTIFWSTVMVDNYLKAETNMLGIIWMENQKAKANINGHNKNACSKGYLNMQKETGRAAGWTVMAINTLETTNKMWKMDMESSVGGLATFIKETSSMISGKAMDKCSG